MREPGVEQFGGQAGAASFDLMSLAALRPQTVLLVFTISHVVLWTLVYTPPAGSLALDTIEGIAFGRDWQLGYWKHPPLPWLILDVVHRLSGSRLWPYFMLGQIAAAVTFWAVWQLGRRIVGAAAALAAVLLLDGEIVFNISAAEFNHNILQLPLFALFGLALYEALQGGRLRDWILVGVWCTLAAYTKYEFIVLLIPALAFSLTDRRVRHCWRTPGPYVAAALFAVLFIPQLVWMARVNQFSPLTFVTDEADPVGPIGLIRSSASFTVNALLYLVPVVALFLFFGRGERRGPGAQPDAAPWARRFLAFLAWGPLIISLAMGIASGRELRSGWTMQFWVFFPLWLITAGRPRIDEGALRRLAGGWIAMTGIFVAISLAASVFLVAQPSLYVLQFPGARFADAAVSAWREKTNGRPLRYIVGPFWPAGTVMLFSREQPHLFDEGSLKHSPLIDPADVRRQGAIIFFEPKAKRNGEARIMSTAPWLGDFPEAEIQPPIIVRQETPVGRIEWAIGWALLKPAGQETR